MISNKPALRNCSVVRRGAWPAMAVAMLGLLAAPESRALDADPPVLVSRTYLGNPAAGPCGSPQFARGNTRYLAFACNGALVAEDDNDHADTYFIDRQTGTIERVSVTSEETEARFDSIEGFPSDDGRYVIFQSEGQLHPDTPATLPRLNVFLRDRIAGTTELISRDAFGNPRPNFFSLQDALPRTREFAMRTPSRVMDPSGDPPFVPSDIYVRNWETGEVELISISTTGTLSDDGAARATMSRMGRFVLFGSSSTNLPGASGPNQGINLYLRDRSTATTTRLTRPWHGGEFQEGMSLDIYRPQISADGRNVLFSSRSRELIQGDSQIEFMTQQVYVLDRQSGQLERLSATAEGEPGNHYNGVADLSDDGRYVAFYSQSTNLPAGDRAIYVTDRLSGESVNVTEPLGSNVGRQPNLDLAADGSAIAFSWRSANAALPDLFDRVLVYTVELQGDGPPSPPARPVPTLATRGWMLLALFFLGVVWLRRRLIRS